MCCTYVRSRVQAVSTMPIDWSLYIPVVCVQKDTKYDGQSYMEPIKNVVKLNGRSVTKSDNLKKCDFKSGDAVTIFFNKSHFDGIVDFTREEQFASESVTCTSSTEIRSRLKRPRSQSPTSSRPLPMKQKQRFRRPSGTLYCLKCSRAIF